MSDVRRFYISANNDKGFEEITEAEWNGLIGEEPDSSFANKVYRGLLSIDDVPEENRATVELIVANKISKWGEYGEQPIRSDELGDMVKGVM